MHLYKDMYTNIPEKKSENVIVLLFSFQVQSGASTKKFTKNKRIKGFRCVGKVNGKW